MQDLPIHADNQSVPVYDCHVIIKKNEVDGRWSGFVSNLPSVTATALNERDLLRSISTQFKARLVQFAHEKQEIPWQADQKPRPDEQQRWIPVHL